MNAPAQKTKRLPYLDGIKTFALLMVFALHTQRGPEVTAPCHDAVLFYVARCCMPLFFMVNGSLMLRREMFDFSYYKKKILGIARVLLLNGICIGVYVFVVHQFPIAKAVKEMLKGFLSYTSYAYLWFLYSFALIYTLLLFGFDWVKKNLNRVLVALGVVCLGVMALSLLSIAQGGFFVQERVTQRLRLWTWLFYFCLGYKVSTFDVSRWSPRLIRGCAAVLTVASTAWQYVLCFRVTGQIESNYMYDDVAIMVWSILLFLAFRVSPRVSAWFGKFAPYSFGAFLIHGFLLDAFQLQSAVNGPAQAGVMWAGLIVVCWVLSWLLSHVPVVREMLRY